MRRSRRGDRDALNLLLQQTTPLVLRMVGAHVRHQQDVLEILQAVLVSIWRSIRMLESPGAFRAWVHQIVRRRVMDHLRKRYADDLDSPRLIDRSMDAFPSCKDGAQLRSGIFEQLVDFIEEGISKQAEEYQTVLRLHLLKGKTNQEIADETGRKVGTVKSLVSRGKARLLTELEDMR